jgi:hypothetical protein
VEDMGVLCDFDTPQDYRVAADLALKHLKQDTIEASILSR